MTWAIAVALVCALSGAVSATTIRYDVAALGGQNWRYDISVENDTLATPIDEFTLYFPSAAIPSLSTSGQPASFDPLVFPPNPVFFPNWAVDYLASSGGIPTGATLEHFLVDVQFTAPGAPGGFAFDIVDPDTFAILESGDAVAIGGGGVPEPATLALVCLALLGVSGSRDREGLLRRSSTRFRRSA